MAEAAQLRVHMDFEVREVTYMVRRPLDIEAVAIKIPFAVAKATASMILKAESEDELTIQQEMGRLATQPETPPAIVTAR